MSERVRNLALVAFGVVLVGAIVWNLLPSDTSSDAGGHGSYARLSTPGSEPSGPSRVDGPESSAGSGEGTTPMSPRGRETVGELVSGGARETRRYAVAVPALEGFPPDVTPGTRLELWVSWDPPLTRRPRVQRLLGAATVVEIVPGLGAQSPATAILEVPERRVGDVVFADRYGALSAVVRP